MFGRSTGCCLADSNVLQEYLPALRKDVMSMTSRTEQTPKRGQCDPQRREQHSCDPQQFTSMDEMKRWQAEREDRLHSEHVRERIHQLAAEREANKQPSAKSTHAVKKSPN